MLEESRKVMDRLKIHIPDFNQEIETLIRWSAPGRRYRAGRLLAGQTDDHG